MPFNTFSLIFRERQPPTIAEMTAGVQSGYSGPYAVLNARFAALLSTLGYGVSLVLATIKQPGSHVGICVRCNSTPLYVDVGNGSPYFTAIPFASPMVYAGGGNSAA